MPDARLVCSRARSPAQEEAAAARARPHEAQDEGTHAHIHGHHRRQGHEGARHVQAGPHPGAGLPAGAAAQEVRHAAAHGHGYGRDHHDGTHDGVRPPRAHPELRPSAAHLRSTPAVVRPSAPALIRTPHQLLRPARVRACRPRAHHVFLRPQLVVAIL